MSDFLVEVHGKMFMGSNRMSNAKINTLELCLVVPHWIGVVAKFRRYWVWLCGHWCPMLYIIILYVCTQKLQNYPWEVGIPRHISLDVQYYCMGTMVLLVSSVLSSHKFVHGCHRMVVCLLDRAAQHSVHSLVSGAPVAFPKVGTALSSHHTFHYVIFMHDCDVEPSIRFSPDPSY